MKKIIEYRSVEGGGFGIPRLQTRVTEAEDDAALPKVLDNAPQKPRFLSDEEAATIKAHDWQEEENS